MTEAEVTDVDVQYMPPERRAEVEPPMVEAVEIVRVYETGAEPVRALDRVSLRVPRAKLLALRGRSGSGKTTLLSIIGGLDRPTEGHVVIDGQTVSEFNEEQLVEFRRHRIGFVFQTMGLLPILSAAENVEIPLRLVKAEPSAREARVRELLTMVGLGERMDHRPYELSGGEQQRVAIARALANRPHVLIADEPTGQLDSDTGRGIMTVLRNLVRDEGITAIVATHDPSLIDLADQVIELRDGRIVTPG
ncbi:MAG TPA: ABC transporter ATP-binding protein [Candidatus Limnocylindrales bacterium]|nr:ABC transporter ATP-binding protein [Candidatus Limnocylindrales bacterium]